MPQQALEAIVEMWNSRWRKLKDPNDRKKEKKQKTQKPKAQRSNIRGDRPVFWTRKQEKQEKQEN